MRGPGAKTNSKTTVTRSFSSRTWLIAAVAVAAYLPALANRYAFDDVYIVARDPAVRSLANVAALFHSDWWAPFGRMGLYRPLTKLTFSLGWATAPDSPGGYHLVNILLHALAAVLVFRLVRRWLPEVFAALAALWFALVPTQVEVVAGLVGRADLLAFVFALLTLLSYLRLEEQPPSQLPRRWLWALAAGACMFLSLLSKESAIVLPGVAVLAGWLLPREEAAPLAFRPRLRRLLANPALFSIPAGAVAYLALRLRVVGLLTRPPDFATAPVGRYGCGFDCRQRASALLVASPGCREWRTARRAGFLSERALASRGAGCGTFSGILTRDTAGQTAPGLSLATQPPIPRSGMGAHGMRCEEFPTVI